MDALNIKHADLYPKVSETMEDMVVYESLRNNTLWVRPASMWNEIVDEKGTLRFTQC